MSGASFLENICSEKQKLPRIFYKQGERGILREAWNEYIAKRETRGGEK